MAFRAVIVTIWACCVATVCGTALLVDGVIDLIAYLHPICGSRLTGRRRAVFVCVLCALALWLCHKVAGRGAGCVCVLPNECTHTDSALSDLGIWSLVKTLVWTLYVACRVLVILVIRVLQGVEWLIR